MKEYCRKEKYQGLFVVDLDGTLLTSERQLAQEDLNALSRLQEMDYLTAIATGRSNYSFDQLMTKLGYLNPANSLPVDYVIFSTGAGIMDFPGKRLLKSFTLSPEDVRCTANYLETSGLDYMIHRPVPDTRHFLYSLNGDNNPDFKSRLEMYGDYGTPISTEALNEFGGATQVLCIVPGDRGHNVATEITSILKQCSVIKATSPLDHNSIWIEIFAPTVSKSKAVKWLADTVGLDRTNICAVGNDYNDEDLLHWAGSSFMVANGPPSLKAIFRGVASNDNCGVCEAAARLLAAA
ncbi:MAG: HAD-IIB family hydrolase [Desulfobulbaceae bacterium]|nr:HAD-IIB family hydrolase [Desulfobulbaceae bacterium]